METQLVQQLTETFEGHAQQTETRGNQDFAPTIILKAKDFATGITIHNARTHGLASETLISRGIHPESLPPEEDVKKVERRLSTVDKKALKNPDTLHSERKTPRT
jgi:DNA-damage-inducible protein D